MAEVSVVMSAQEASLWRAQQKLIAQTAALEAGYTKAGAAGQRAGGKAAQSAKHQQTEMERVNRTINTAITRYGSMAAAIGLVRQATSYMNQETDKATASVERLGDSRRRLNQVAITVDDLKQMEETADKLAAKYGVEREVAHKVVFSARSELFEGFAEEIIASARFVAPESAAGVAGQVPGLFPGKGLTPAQAVNMTSIAATKSRLDFEEIAAAIPKAAAGGEAAGATPAETMAALSVLASRFASGHEAANRISTFGSKVAADEQLKGMGITAAAKAIQAAPEERRKEFLAENIELNTAYRDIIQEMAAMEQRQREIEAIIPTVGTSESPFAKGRERAEATRKEEIDAAKARIGREIANEKRFAQAGFQRQAALDRAMSGVKNAKTPWPIESAAQAAGWTAKSLGAPAPVVEVLPMLIQGTSPPGLTPGDSLSRRIQAIERVLHPIMPIPPNPSEMYLFRAIKAMLQTGSHSVPQERQQTTSEEQRREVMPPTVKAPDLSMTQPSIGGGMVPRDPDVTRAMRGATDTMARAAESMDKVANALSTTVLNQRTPPPRPESLSNLQRRQAAVPA